MPEQKTLDKMQKFVDRFREKTGTFGYPDAKITEILVEGLAGNVEEVGRPMCPCQFFPEGKAEAAKSSEWVCPCWEFQIWKYCHWLLFCDEGGSPITEHLPEGHEGLKMYGEVKDPTPDKGRALKHRSDEYEKELVEQGRIQK